jgi:hypothetical protein
MEACTHVMGQEGNYFTGEDIQLSVKLLSCRIDVNTERPVFEIACKVE